MSMEQNGNHQNMATPLYCRNGCGFYAAQAFDGMCSKCYKDLKQPSQPAVVATPSTPTSARLAADSEDVDAVAAALSKTSLGEMNVNASSNSSNNDKFAGKLSSSPSPPEVETGSPTVPRTKPSTSAEKEDEQTETAVAEGEASGELEKGKKPKKNRCQECRKKVGLTGFQCHCGKLFCSLHRYSDTHHCTFDFKEKGQEEIRRNNPVIKGEKIQKI